MLTSSALAGAIYQIRVTGELNTTLLNAVDDMQLRQENGQNSIALVGWLPDQSALLGLLYRLNEIRYEILSVEIFAPNESTLMT
ncbi:hypothetical protein SAMN06265375_1032 [Muriicola jejuensis]|uniref:Uncharacterized protein n=1 Tax=Muriicola jejuensis TaxID=504488 RepID=A0A6P0UMW7_9FLAO|nr:hypothetical protein [Muriicola jejuensis]NER11626.1 hypothetical protein [Muriicola jejuensis]SMP19228.1 hypothetical protein SAMN06265375_1032 [Muriicola jejuensis]